MTYYETANIDLLQSSSESNSCNLHEGQIRGFFFKELTLLRIFKL